MNERAFHLSKNNCFSFLLSIAQFRSKYVLVFDQVIFSYSLIRSILIKNCLENVRKGLLSHLYKISNIIVGVFAKMLSFSSFSTAARN